MLKRKVINRVKSVAQCISAIIIMFAMMVDWEELIF